METLNNLNWNLIGGVLAGLSLLASIIIFLLQKNEKKLSFEVIAETSLLTTKEKIEGKLKILFNDQEVENVKFIEIKIINSGNIGIPATDFERPIKIKFPETSKILSCEVVENYPDSLNTKTLLNETGISIEPLLINSKDYFILKTIVSNIEREDFTIEARIKDVNEIKRLDESNQFLIWASLGLMLTLTGMVRLPISDKSFENLKLTTDNYINVGLIIVGYIAMFFAMSKNKKLFKLILLLKRRE